MIFTLEEIKEIAIPIACECGVSKMGLFDSYARGDQDEDSDLDFYIDRGQMRSLLEYTGFVMRLEEEFHCHVDVVSMGIKDKDFLNSILREGFLIYEK